MTIMQAKLIKHLKDKDVKTLADAGRKAGYTDKARSIYRPHTKAHIKEALKCNPDSIKAHYQALYDECMLKGDRTNAKGILDSLARINALFIERTLNKTEFTTKDQSLLDGYCNNRLLAHL